MQKYSLYCIIINYNSLYPKNKITNCIGRSLRIISGRGFFCISVLRYLDGSLLVGWGNTLYVSISRHSNETVHLEDKSWLWKYFGLSVLLYIDLTVVLQKVFFVFLFTALFCELRLKSCPKLAPYVRKKYRCTITTPHRQKNVKIII